MSRKKDIKVIATINVTHEAAISELTMLLDHQGFKLSRALEPVARSSTEFSATLQETESSGEFWRFALKTHKLASGTTCTFKVVYEYASAALRKAISNNDLDLALRLIDAGQDFDTLYSQETFLIHIAISTNLDIARALLRAGANPNMPSVTQQYTPIMTAIRNRHATFIPELVAAGADPALRTAAGTALDYARKLRLTAAVTVLEPITLVTNGDRFSVALRANDLVGIKQLLTNGLSADARFDDDLLLIHVAIERRCPSVVRLLLGAGANPNLCTSKKLLTPLMLAVVTGQSGLIEDLIAAGADPNISTKAGTALQIARNRGNTVAISLLEPLAGPLIDRFKAVLAAGDASAAQMILDEGLDANTMFDKTMNLLHAAIKFHQLDIARALLRAGANPNMPTTNGKAVSPLMIVIDTQQLTFIPELVAAGADPAVRAGNVSAIEHAKRAGGAAERALAPYAESPIKQFQSALTMDDEKTVANLLAAGLDPNTLFDGTCNILHKSIEMSKLGIARALLKAGANPNAPATKTQYTPIMIALQKGLKDFIPELVAAGADPALRTTAGTAISMAEAANDFTLKSVLSKAKAGDADVVITRKAKLKLTGPNALVDGNFYKLHTAIAAKDIAAAKELLLNGADPNLPSVAKQYTPIMVAVQYGMLDLIPVLVEAGADPALATQAGTALQIAKANKNKKAITMLQKLTK